MTQKPNILLILSDQHNPHILGCAGDEVIRTPNLDQLAARGTLFTNNYCPSPLCVPSRMAFLTSQNCSDIQVWSNYCILSSDVPTFVHGLGIAGYETILCGRMHFTGTDQRHGFHSRIIGDVDPSLGHIPRGTTGQTKVAVEVAGSGRTAYKAYDDAVTETCCEFIKERAQANEGHPFFMVVGYVLPHCPYICPKRLFDEYFDKVDVPQLPPGYPDNLHPAIKAWRQRRGVDELTNNQRRIARAAYYGLVTYMDERIGEIFQTLEESGLAENTIVIYTSDHGDMAGEHGMWWKSNFYEGSVGVPLIFSWPGNFSEGKRITEVTSLLDIGPTLLDIVGAESLPFAVGNSMAGFLTGSDSVIDWPNQIFAEYCGLLNDRPAFMVRQGAWKLNYYHGCDTPQLFNLEDDPDETIDRGSDATCSGVREELMEIVGKHWSGDEVERAMNKKMRHRELLQEWRANIPSKRHAKDTTQERWKAPPDCNVFQRRLGNLPTLEVDKNE